MEMPLSRAASRMVWPGRPGTSRPSMFNRYCFIAVPPLILQYSGEFAGIYADTMQTYLDASYWAYRDQNDTALGKKIYALIQNNISAYCAHTNLDIAFGGTNDTLAKIAGMENIKILQQTSQEELKKIVYYCVGVYFVHL